MRRLIALTLALGLCGCFNDEQDHPADGMAGAPGAGESGAGESGADGGVSEGGNGGAPSTEGLVDGCADLDTDGIADCEITLVETPSFTSDVSGWTPVGDSELTWDPRNALDDQDSGSAKLTAAAQLARASQCVPWNGEQLVIAYANAFVGTFDEDEEPGQALLEVSFFESDDCSDARHGYFETPPSAVADEWTIVQAGAISSAETNSVSIALVGLTSVSPVSVYFDNVMLKAQEL